MIIALISMAHTPLLHNKQIPVKVRERLYVLSCSKFLFHRQIILQNGFIKLTCNFANYPTDSKLLLLYLQCSASQPINYRSKKITLCLDYMHQKKSQNIFNPLLLRFSFQCTINIKSYRNFALQNMVRKFPMGKAFQIFSLSMHYDFQNDELSFVKCQDFFVFKVGTCQRSANTCNISILTVL